MIVGNILSLITFILIDCLKLFLRCIIFAIRQASYEQDAKQFTPIHAIICKFLQLRKLHVIRRFKITVDDDFFKEFPKIIDLLSLKFNVYDNFIKTLN